MRSLKVLAAIGESSSKLRLWARILKQGMSEGMLHATFIGHKAHVPLRFLEPRFVKMAKFSVR
jgi:hypothetical protein